MQAAKQEVMHHARLAEPHFHLGRMGVDVDPRRVQFQIEHIDRMPAVIQHVLIGLPNRDADQFVPHQSAIDVEKLMIGLAA